MQSITNLPIKTRLAVAALSLLAIFLFTWRFAFHGVELSAMALIVASALGLVFLALLVGIGYAQLNQAILRHGGTDPDWLIFPNDPPGLESLRQSQQAHSESTSRGA